MQKNLSFFTFVLLFGVIGVLVWVLAIPHNDANDEYLHYGLAEFIADEGRFPVYNKDDYLQTSCKTVNVWENEQQTTQWICQGPYSIFPFPSYLISALFIAPVAPDAPYRYIFARLPNLLYAALFFMLTWGILQRLFASKIMRITLMTALVCIPQVTFLNAYVNSDGFSLAIGTFIIYMWVRVMQDGLTNNNILFTAISLGLLASAKYNYFILFPATAIFLILSFKQLGWKKIALLSGVSALSIALLSGWWYARNAILYGDAFGFATVLRTVNALAPDRTTLLDAGHTIWTLLFASNWSILSFESFFAVFGWMSIHLPGVLYLAILFIIVLAMFGWLFSLINRLTERSQLIQSTAHNLLPFVAACVVTFFGAVGLSLWTSLSNDYQPQGRYLFPALLPVFLGIAGGLQRFSSTMQWNNKYLLVLFTAVMTTVWTTSHILLIFYYESIRKDPAVLGYFASYNSFFFSTNNQMMDVILAGSTCILGALLCVIWRRIIQSFRTDRLNSG